MIQVFVDTFIGAKDETCNALRLEHPKSYDDLVTRLLMILSNIPDFSAPDPERITIINYGDYQGTRLYIVGSKGCQPWKYWSICVGYGSCPTCDTFEAIQHSPVGDCFNPLPTEEQVNEYWTLMLHMVQSMKELEL